MGLHIDEITARRKMYESYEIIERLFQYNLAHPIKGAIAIYTLEAIDYLGNKVRSASSFVFSPSPEIAREISRDERNERDN